MNKKKDFFSFIAAVVVLILVPFSYACSCGAAEAEFDEYFALRFSSPEQEKVGAIKTQLEGFNIDQSVQAQLDDEKRVPNVQGSQNPYYSYHMSTWRGLLRENTIYSKCPKFVKVEKDQDYSCTLFFESKAGLINKGWRIHFVITPKRIVTHVGVDRAYGVIGYEIYADPL
jgi:hypothetical protein